MSNSKVFEKIEKEYDKINKNLVFCVFGDKRPNLNSEWTIITTQLEEDIDHPRYTSKFGNGTYDWVYREFGKEILFNLAAKNRNKILAFVYSKAGKFFEYSISFFILSMLKHFLFDS